MPRTSEVAFNSLFAEVLRGKHPLWRDHLRVEQSGVFADSPRLRPDLLVQRPDTQPVAIETEYEPASSVEYDAKTRLGRTPVGFAEPIEQAIAVRIPPPPAKPTWPDTGWLVGDVDDIARPIEHAVVSERKIREFAKKNRLRRADLAARSGTKSTKENENTAPMHATELARSRA